MSEPSPRNGTSAATAWGFLAPGLILISLSVLIPAAMALVMSFTQSGLDVSEPLRFVGLANIRRLLSDPMFFRVLGTTLLYLVGVVPPVVLGSLALAVLVNRQLPGIHWFRAAFYTPVLVSIVMRGVAVHPVRVHGCTLSAGFVSGTRENYTAFSVQSPNHSM